LDSTFNVQSAGVFASNINLLKQPLWGSIDETGIVSHTVAPPTLDGTILLESAGVPPPHTDIHEGPFRGGVFI